MRGQSVYSTFVLQTLSDPHYYSSPDWAEPVNILYSLPVPSYDNKNVDGITDTPIVQ